MMKTILIYTLCNLFYSLVKIGKILQMIDTALKSKCKIIVTNDGDFIKIARSEKYL